MSPHETLLGNRTVGVVDESSTARKRNVAVGVGLAVVGVFILFFSLTVLTVTVYADPGGRRAVYHWPTITAGLTLIAMGFAVSMMRLRSERR